MFTACAGMGIKIDTTEKKYLAARAELNLLLEQYIQIQDTIPDKEHKAASTAFITADTTLDTWECFLDKKDYDYSTNLLVWLEAKRTILLILRGL